MDTTSKLIPVQNAITDTAPESQSAEFLKEMEIDVLARTLWGEARGEGSTGMEAVASVILNRVEVAKRRGHYWWGNKINLPSGVMTFATIAPTTSPPIAQAMTLANHATNGIEEKIWPIASRP